MTQRFLAVKDFGKFQHYRDRRPPWIKLYATVLTDATFLQLPEAAQAQLMKLWVLASQFGHPLPNNPKLLQGKIGATGRFYLRELIESGFLIPISGDASKSASNDASKSAGTDASNSLDECYAYARGDARSRESSESREQRGEKDLPPRRSSRSSPQSGNLDPERGAAPPAPPFASLRELTAAAPEVARFVEHHYAAETTAIARRADVGTQLLATLNGGVLLAGQRVQAYSLARLEIKCREVLTEGVRDRDKAIVVLLKKLADTSDGSAPGVQAVNAERREEKRDANELAAAEAWLDRRPDVGRELDRQLDADGWGTDTDIARASRAIARRTLVLGAYREYRARASPDPATSRTP